MTAQGRGADEDAKSWARIDAQEKAEAWWGVWCEQRGTGQAFWRGTQDDESVPLQTTETEAKRLAGALNEFAHDRTDSLGWTYEARRHNPPTPSADLVKEARVPASTMRTRPDERELAYGLVTRLADALEQAEGENALLTVTARQIAGAADRMRAHEKAQDDLLREATKRAEKAEGEGYEAGRRHERNVYLEEKAAILKRAEDAEALVVLVAERMTCGCWSRDCAKHGAYDPEDHARLAAARKLASGGKGE